MTPLPRPPPPRAPFRRSIRCSVQNLATAASLSSKAFAGANTAVGTGTLTISVGGNTSAINIDSTNNTLAGIAAAINGAAG